MSTYDLSIIVSGPGGDLKTRSHWSFGINKPNEDIGDIIHVLLIDHTKLWYQYDARSGIQVQDKPSEGSFLISSFPASQKTKVIDVISKEPAPRDGKRRCQDWCFECILALEIEELVPSGTSESVQGLIGLSAKELAARIGKRWRDTTTR